MTRGEIIAAWVATALLAGAIGWRWAGHYYRDRIDDVQSLRDQLEAVSSERTHLKSALLHTVSQPPTCPLRLRLAAEPQGEPRAEPQAAQPPVTQ